MHFSPEGDISEMQVDDGVNESAASSDDEEMPPEMPAMSQAFKASAHRGGNVFEDFEIPEKVQVQDRVDPQVEEAEETEESLTECNKKAIATLQHKFSSSFDTMPWESLSYKSMIPMPNDPNTSHGTTRMHAALSFFELLNFHAKGYIELHQSDAYGDITTTSTGKLRCFRCG